MPISVATKLTSLSQSEFAEASYAIMAEIFALHAELGRLFDEEVYKQALKYRLDNLQTEVKINVSFRDFCKSYFMDAVVSAGAVLELKAVDQLHGRHRSQLLNYLLLSDLRHGKLINLRPEKVEHEFVNNKRTYAERTKFGIDDSTWHATDGFGCMEKDLLEEMLRDWGTGLERALYEEALIHFFGGATNVPHDINVFLNRQSVAKQTVNLCAPSIAFRLTTFENCTNSYRKDLVRFLTRTELHAIHWINISHRTVSIETLKE